MPGDFVVSLWHGPLRSMDGANLNEVSVIRNELLFVVSCTYNPRISSNDYYVLCREGVGYILPVFVKEIDG